jgi:K+-sensing histidine kinase KdpD
MRNEQPEQVDLPYEQILHQYQDLQREMEQLRVQESIVWNLFTETSRKLQVYTASIKAAVSSLLSYDIFWDNANQHEFLETINGSIDQISDLVMLMTLALRFEAGKLDMRNEPQMIQEILSKVYDSAGFGFHNLTFNVDFPKEGKPVLVDFEYLFLAIKLLLSVVASDPQPASIHVQTTEGEKYWLLDFDGIHPSVLDSFQDLTVCNNKYVPDLNRVSTENALRLYVVFKIFCLQDINIQIMSNQEGNRHLRLYIPVYNEKAEGKSPSLDDPMPVSTL